eukprot:CAMPEP_0203769134 /NCGR_PEP_ID=MMETSP0099_2-20121227/2007_1 /ASSEMBLY_ACC=CAM_ASM_000209 /TAXON_ID=96639 /ORGANISM=" , Strain NY0313808BC1" /LENGTH=406 /DNA_ID=CAMNT_0050665967 /DNA_START=76 /DNA_END=1293 /DNA_ORIENTATION=-
METCLLKGSCDACTTSKVKCGGGNPCSRCSQKGIACAYRPKRKRGPQKKGGRSNKKQFEEEDFAFISSYEKRIWSVFFTMFKNQNRARTDAHWAYCWFLNKLNKLKDYVTVTKNEHALNRINAWLDALDVDLGNVVKGMEKTCIFNPGQCGSCSAIAMSAPSGVNKQDIISQLHIGEDFSLAIEDKPIFLMVHSREGTSVQVNGKFSSEFGLTASDIEDLLAWSGGGFLPWGGDVLAKLVVKEEDLHVFLQILAIKFQALGPPKHGRGVTSEREIPSTHIFQLNCAQGKRATFMLRCVHIEHIDNDQMTTTLKISFEQIGEKEGSDSTNNDSIEQKTQEQIKRRKIVPDTQRFAPQLVQYDSWSYPPQYPPAIYHQGEQPIHYGVSGSVPPLQAQSSVEISSDELW